MIVDLDFTSESFSKLLVLALQAEELLGNIDDENQQRDLHRASAYLYNLINRNQKEDFNFKISGYLSELNTLALNKPYNNHNILLLIEAINDATRNHPYYRNLKDLYPDIIYNYISTYDSWTYRKDAATNIEEPPVQEAEGKNINEDFNFEDSNEFDFSDEVVTKTEETAIVGVTNDCANELKDEPVKPVGDNVIKRQNTINEKEVEKRAMAQASSVKSNTITEEDIKGQSKGDFDTTFDMDDEDAFNFSIKPEPTDVNNNATTQKRELKSWVIPLFALAGLVLFGSLLYGYLN